MDRALSRSADFVFGVGNMTVEVAHAQDICFMAQYATAFKLQGSSDGGATYADIEDSAMAGDGSVGEGMVMSVYRSLFDHLKVVMTSVGGETASCVVCRRWIRNQPPLGIDDDFRMILIDPVLGTP